MSLIIWTVHQFTGEDVQATLYVYIMGQFPCSRCMSISTKFALHTGTEG